MTKIFEKMKKVLIFPIKEPGLSSEVAYENFRRDDVLLIAL